MFCEKCGKQINDDASFCPFCGYTIGQSENKDMKVSDSDGLKNQNAKSGSPNSVNVSDKTDGQNETKKQGKKKILIPIIVAVILIAGLGIFMAINSRGTTVRVGNHTVTVPTGYILYSQKDLNEGFYESEYYDLNVMLSFAKEGKEGNTISVSIKDMSAESADLYGSYTEDDLSQFMDLDSNEGAHFANTKITLGDYIGIWATFDENDETGLKATARVISGTSQCTIYLRGMDNPQEVLEKIKITQ